MSAALLCSTHTADNTVRTVPPLIHSLRLCGPVPACSRLSRVVFLHWCFSCSVVLRAFSVHFIASSPLDWSKPHRMADAPNTTPATTGQDVQLSRSLRSTKSSYALIPHRAGYALVDSGLSCLRLYLTPYGTTCKAQIFAQIFRGAQFLHSAQNPHGGMLFSLQYNVEN